MSVSFKGVGQVCATFWRETAEDPKELLAEGQMAMLTGNGTVGRCGDGEDFCGVALSCRDDACTVQVGGFVTAAYSGSTPTLGWCVLAGNGAGGVKTAANGTSYLVVDCDVAAGTVTFLL